MSNTTDSLIDDAEIYWNDVIFLLNQNISRYGMGFVWLLGNFGSLMNCLIFYQPNLRKNPCVMYFLASSASQFLTFNFALLTRMLQYGYDVQAVTTYLWFCKVRFYFFYIFVAIPRYYIVWASIDRCLASSSNTAWRRWSSSKFAWRLILGSIPFWCLVYVQVLVLYEIRNNNCSFPNGSYGIFFCIYLSIESGILPPTLMLTFGYITLKNIQQSKKRTRPLPQGGIVQPARLATISRKDLQFSMMLFNQICLWVILNFFNPCYLLYRTITLNDVKSSFRLGVESFIHNLSYFLIYVEFSLTFFVYTLSSPLFRRELKQLIRKKVLRRPGANVVARSNS